MQAEGLEVDVSKRIKDYGLRTVLGPTWDEWWARLRPARVREYTGPLAQPREEVAAQETCGVTGSDGQVCTFQGTRLQVVTHRRLVHGVRDPVRGMVPTNECPLCGRVYKQSRDAGDHVVRAVGDGCCPPSQVSAKFPAELREVDEWECPRGCGVIRGHGTIREHAAAHLRDLACESAGL